MKKQKSLTEAKNGLKSKVTKPTKQTTAKIGRIFKNSNFAVLSILKWSITQLEFTNFIAYHNLLVSADFNRDIVMIYKPENKSQPLTGNELTLL